MHGMVLVVTMRGIIPTCLCGWFSPEAAGMVDYASVLWRDHMNDEGII